MTWQPRAGIITAGLGLIVIQLAVAALSSRFSLETDFETRPLLSFVTLQMVAGGIYLLAMMQLYRISLGRSGLILLLLAGLVMRVVLFDSTPILEIDYYRYLWDGAVVANGHNPYLLAPIEAQTSRLADLALQSGPVIERINYADLRTIYPPVTQAFFALSYWLDSWSLDAWRGVLLAADCVALLLILGVLQTLGKPLQWSLVYWLNPLLLQQTYNGLHMEVLLIVPLVAAIWLLLAHRQACAAVVLSLAAGIKLWPLLLLPFALRPLLDQPRRLSGACLAITGVLVLAVLPLFYYGLGEQSGLGSFARDWLRNSGIYPLLESTIGLVVDHPAGMTRVLIALGLAGCVAWFNRSAVTDPDVLVQRLLWVIVLLFLLSPAQFPWYTLWFLPLLCFVPSAPLLLLTALMPIYYLKFHFAYQGNPEVFDRGLVWLQYLPVLGWLAWERIAQYRPAAVRLRHV